MRYAFAAVVFVLALGCNDGASPDMPTPDILPATPARPAPPAIGQRGAWGARWLRLRERHNVSHAQLYSIDTWGRHIRTPVADLEEIEAGTRPPPGASEESSLLTALSRAADPYLVQTDLGEERGMLVMAAAAERIAWDDWTP